LHIAIGQDIDVGADVINLKQAGLHAIVQIGCEVGNLVGQIDDLRLQRRPPPEQVAGEIWMLIGAVIARMLDDPFAYTEREVQTTMRSVTLLEMLDDAERMQVMVEAQSVAFQTLIERAFPSVAEWRGPDVV